MAELEPGRLRAASLLFVLSGIAHLVAPQLLVRVAAAAYDRVLAVEFRPRENTARRVRLLGIVSLFLAAVCHRFSTADST